SIGKQFQEVVVLGKGSCWRNVVVRKTNCRESAIVVEMCLSEK
ncbi:5925_t:CDS:1, partial [Gigaspora rosea]